MSAPYQMDAAALLTKTDEQDIQKFFQEFHAPNWHPCYSDKEGCVVSWKEDPNCPIIMVKGTVRIKASLLQVASFISDSDKFELYMKTCDKMVKNARVVEVVDTKHYVMHATFGLPPPLWPRDFCWAETHTFLPDGTYIDIARSVEHPDCPPVTGKLISAVRGQIVGSGYWLQPVADDPDSCIVSYQVQCDPKGMIPTAVVNMVCKDQGKNVKRLKAYMERKNKH